MIMFGLSAQLAVHRRPRGAPHRQHWRRPASRLTTSAWSTVARGQPLPVTTDLLVWPH
jgi:hypothetical protein